MLQYSKPTHIELKKTDIEDFERKRTEDLKQQRTAEKLPLADISKVESAPPPTGKARQTEIRRRLGFTPEAVANDGTTGIRF